MADRTKTSDPSKLAHRAFWASAVFYILIAFEFFYMASPFAAYFYAVYGPGLDALQGLGFANWTVQFFLPHALEATTSPIVPILESLGIGMFLIGVSAFAFGVFQIYRAKLFRQDAVMGGLYRHIRHPQYLALIVASIGMLLIWPRFLVLILTVVVIFLYIALAKVEEQICLAKYPGYAEYMARTGMFLPRKLEMPNVRLGFGETRIARFAKWITVFVLSLVVALSLANALRTHAIAHLVHIERPEGVYLSGVEIDTTLLEQIVELATSTTEAQSILSDPASRPILGYVLPTEVYVSEIPMHLPEGETFGHHVPSDYDRSRFKVILTRAVTGSEYVPMGLNIVREAFNKSPLLEVQVMLDSGATTVLPTPEVAFYADHQVPLF